MDSHKKAVEEISATVRKFYERKEKFRISHGSTNSTRPNAAKGKNLVDTSGLRNVLNIDIEKRTALLEPNVPMDRLIEATLKHNLIPPVVMEFPGITVGGGYAGTSGESSSFKYGYFNETMNLVEMVLATGEVVKCSKHEKPDLFYGAAGTAGTLGVVTMVELQLHEAKTYVETTYHPVSSSAEAVEKIKHMIEDTELDFIDGILFSKYSGAVITGRLTNELDPEIPVQRFSAAKDPWFYLHARKAISKSQSPTTETIPLAEYLFRYDRGGFWVGESAFKYFKTPFTNFTRRLLDDFLHTRVMYTALHASGLSKRFVIQDISLPYSTVGQFIDYTDAAFGIYPLWLCPLRGVEGSTLHPHLIPSNASEAGNLEQQQQQQQPLLNVGLWGFGPAKYDAFVAMNRELEQKIRELRGMKFLYAHVYYSEDDFWSVYDRKWYDALREKYDATSLPSIYEKVRIDVEAERRGLAKGSIKGLLLNTWPLQGLYGAMKAWSGGSYRDARDSAWKSPSTTTQAR